jgi:hypothetical protein
VARIPFEKTEAASTEVDTSNDYLLSHGQNLPNHSTSMQGLGGFVRQSLPELPTFRTKQAAFRYAAYLITMADIHLPNEDGAEAHTFEVVLDACRNA